MGDADRTPTEQLVDNLRVSAGGAREQGFDTWSDDFTKAADEIERLQDLLKQATAVGFRATRGYEQAAQRLLSEVELQEEGLPSDYTDALSADIKTVVQALAEIKRLREGVRCLLNPSLDARERAQEREEAVALVYEEAEGGR